MALARTARRSPRELAEQLIARLPESDLWTEVSIAGPGFINFTLAPSAYHRIVHDALEQGARFGTSELGANRPVQVEFVSANPTGPLHVGHGRGAAYGDTLANLLEAVGFKVQREYYVNDAGRQMDILATSVWLRYLELCGESLPFPSNGYRGDYVGEFAHTLRDENGCDYVAASAEVFRDIPADEPQGGDKEAHIDALVLRCRAFLGEASYQRVFQLALDRIVTDIREDLSEFGVVFDRWYSERSLSQDGLIDKAVDLLKDAGHLYQRDGALWFRATDFGDEKDRVVQRENGQTTYFASDIAYHMDKLDRGFDRIVDVWGADHHGYIARVKAALAALGRDPDRLDVPLVQFANLYRGGQKVQMSTRSGKFVTLRELREEVGVDSARFFYVMRKCEQHLDFDLDLATSRSNDNPMFYVQYAHARICSVMSQLENKGWQHDPTQGMASLDRLEQQHEQELLVGLSRYPETVEAAALNGEPHLLTQYLRDLATGFHSYYNSHQFLVEDAPLRDARLNLILAARQAIANGLTLLGVSAPESM
jgi:arginyl-tRNA synthetase